MFRSHNVTLEIKCQSSSAGMVGMVWQTARQKHEKRRCLAELPTARQSTNEGGEEQARPTGRKTQLPARHQSRIAFWAGTRFAASSSTTDCGPSSTASVTSQPRFAGRQCMKIASGAAIAITASSTR